MQQMSLFENRQMMTPLASRLRPDSLEDFVGQEHLIGRGKILRQLIEKDILGSSRCGEDHPCQYHRGQDEVGVYQFQCCDKRDKGN